MRARVICQAGVTSINRPGKTWSASKHQAAVQMFPAPCKHPPVKVLCKSCGLQNSILTCR